MIDQNDTYLPPAPQSGRPAGAAEHEDDQTGLWSQMLAVFRDIGGSFDPFANDANPEVRALGRAARQRRPPQADDYFALGDLCARLTLHNAQLNEAYIAKAIAAYTRAAEIEAGERRPARVAVLTFAQWVVDVARALGSFEALKAAVLACERVQQLDLLANKPADRAHLYETEQRLREQMQRQASTASNGANGHDPQLESQMLCDQGQMLLRQSQPKEAFDLFERALQINQRSHAAWLWRAMALTDMGRFNDALASYDHALEIEPDNARVWNSKGALLTELGRAEAALECVNRAIELSTSDAKTKSIFWLNRGKALFILKRYREAREALVRSYQLDPSPESAAGIAACREQLEFVSSQAVGAA
ncbi:MAG TPA: tetratricopeptide repeat protein [Kouleothrix sp.]|uniref:tetratricopeptide repeat protein n=1 Tax=Kouleothrix sp. TaxID=2779161 RepID=UPI002BA1DA88|nr:tetratricopeptide repeat protein [Kouleothrix sp.]HRC76830.1 tetratricopeptide repeat protein [Kouleothrix sp.]